MTRTLLISAALFTFACGHNAQQSNAQNDTAASGAASRPSTGAGSATGGAYGTTGTNAGSDKVTLVGCLQGPSQPATAGNAGSAAGDRARARATGNGAATAETHGAAANARYVLMHASVESGGTGANGAGASGGPLISAGSEVELDGVPADAQASVNKQVRVVGRVDSRPAGATGTAGAASAGTSGASGTAGAASSGNSGSGVGSPSGMGSATAGSASGSATGGASTRDDVRANSTTIAGDTTNRRMTVETVQVVASTCNPR